MPRTGTGPFPAQRSPSLGRPYGPAASSGQYAYALSGGGYGSGVSGGYGSGASGGYGPGTSGGYGPGGYGPGTSGGYGPGASGGQYSGDGPAAQWPLRSQLTLGALPGAVPCARLHARMLLWEWGLTSLSENVELIVSELATNALRASADGVAGLPSYDAQGRQRSIGLRLASDGQQVLVEVWDGNPAPPEPGKVSQGGETGRGLLMVEAVSTRWGYYYPSANSPDQQAVKVVWALIQPA